GFLGRHVVRELLRRRWRVRAAVRRPDLAGHLQPLGQVGWVQPVQANLRYRWSIDRAVTDADAVVNLVAILNERGRQRFDAVHAFGARAVAEAARGVGVSRLVHVSAIGADPDSQSAYARTKAAGEAAVFETVPDAVVFRPSIMFGPEDHFFNRFAAMARMLPAFPLFGGGSTRFQPAFVGDVASAIADAIEGKVRRGMIYELGGPEIRTFRQCLELMLETIERRRLLVPVPWPLAVAAASVLQHLPKPLITVDQIRQLQVDNVVSEAAVAEGRTFGGVGIQPTSLEAILPSYLYRFRARGQFDRRSGLVGNEHGRGAAGRPAGTIN
ncbi:MAG TPA: complex I NDUFA9 subunit family protein, partial [Methylomirabilota bacterium]|nr:complex I NDUFA9 subunit family protein [Methylomirabilota bacterium]